MHPTFNIERVIDGPSGAIATVLVPVVYRNADDIPGQTSIVTMGNGEWGMGYGFGFMHSTWYS